MVALRDGKREFFRKMPIYTNLCMSQKRVRDAFVQAVADYAENHRNYDYLRISLSDGNCNHCECEECQKQRPADWYVMTLNEIDEELTRRNLPTRLTFSSYMDTYFAPEKVRINNPSRFVMTYAPITRDYQSSVTEVEGQVCFQSVAIDVTEVMQLRNQMRLLSRFLSDDVAFVLREGEKAWKYRVVVHGLEEKLGMTSEAFEDLLNSGALYRSLSPEVAQRLASVTYQTLEKKDPIEFAFTLHTPAGRAVPLHMKVDFVCDAETKVDFICVFRAVEGE